MNAPTFADASCLSTSCIQAPAYQWIWHDSTPLCWRARAAIFFLKMRLLARRYLGSSYRCIAIWSQIILLTKRQNGSKLKWENCSHYPKVRLDKQTLLFLPLTHICLEGPLGSRGSQKFHCQKYLRNFLQTVLVILCAE